MSNPFRYTLVETSTYRGYPVLFEPGNPSHSALIKEALDRYIDQIEAITSHYSDVFLVRFDLHLPIPIGSDLIPADESNRRVSQLFQILKENKFRQPIWSGQKIKKSAYGWCNELETRKQLHYHCWVAVPKGRVENAGSIRKREDGSYDLYGLIGTVFGIWQQLNPEGYAHVQCNALDSKRIKSNSPDDLGEAIKWISYLTKVRGKVTFEDDDGDPIRVRRFDGSRLKPAPKPQEQADKLTEMAG
ncbi:inovirus Gp2 family protein [Pseudomonas capeferrum]|uniref:YagK/YfjJ domain-containing protein n=1 Tax=Pseudomonas capeferrum TaxID=1495066 RepID=UPI0015E33ED2|nr:inovirus-type Gp2 protein [Pseudomonas capeferrum]MBA1205413.1 inovirus Gp2 family protein [Pseudomonas capeferrum]